MMCQPNCVLIGFEISFVSSEKAALSNSGTVEPCWTGIFPPNFAEPVSVEFSFASFAKFAPSWSSA